MIISSDAGFNFERDNDDGPLRKSSPFSRGLDIVYPNVGGAPASDNDPPIWLLTPGLNAGSLDTYDPDASGTLGIGVLAKAVGSFPLSAVQKRVSPKDEDRFKQVERDFNGFREDAYRQETLAAYQALRQGLLADDRLLTLLFMSIDGESSIASAQQAKFRAALKSGTEEQVDAVENAFLESLRDRIVRCKTAFAHTSTLEDDIAPDQARAIFDLGRLLVVFSWPDLKTKLDKLVQTSREPSQVDQPSK